MGPALGLRSLSAEDPAYRPHYAGDPQSRDSAYHQGTVWSWLLGPYITALVRYQGKEGREQARRAFLRRCKVYFPSDWQRQSDELYAGFLPFLETVLRRSVRLHEALSAFPDRPPGPEVFLIGSATRPTRASAELSRARNEWRLHIGSSSAGAGGGKAPGDGTVTAASFTWGAALDPGVAVSGSGQAGAGFPVTWVDERHARLPRNLDVLARIAEILSP